MENVMFLEDCVSFFQLKSGKWAGHSFFHTLVSVDAFPQGEMPDGFKHEYATIATPEESDEYWALLREWREKNVFEPSEDYY